MIFSSMISYSIEAKITPLDLKKASTTSISQLIQPGADNLVKFYLTIDLISPGRDFFIKIFFITR
jgi:hypothetical protein